MKNCRAANTFNGPLDLKSLLSVLSSFFSGERVPQLLVEVWMSHTN